MVQSDHVADESIDTDTDSRATRRDLLQNAAALGLVATLPAASRRASADSSETSDGDSSDWRRVARWDEKPEEDPFYGHVDVRLDVDAETYQRLRAEYERISEDGYSSPFDTFVYNNCRTNCYVTVDGERIDEP